MPAPSRAIPRNVWMLGFVSLLMDTSSESIHALLPLYMVGTLGASTLLVGIVEGFAEATALVVKVFSGYWSDKTRRRKPLVLLGYGIAALSKFAFPLWLGVDEPDGKTASSAAKRMSLADLKRLDHRFAIVTTIAIVMTLARFSEAFLVLRAQNVGLDVEHAPWVMVAMSIVYAALALPAGRLADRGYALALLAAGLVALVASDLVLASAAGAFGALAGAGLWGLHMALTQGLLAALVSEVAPADLRGSAFGVFNLGSGIALLISSALAGGLWQWVGPAATFVAGAGFAAVALVGLLAFRRQLPSLGAAQPTGLSSRQA